MDSCQKEKEGEKNSGMVNTYISYKYSYKYSDNYRIILHQTTNGYNGNDTCSYDIYKIETANQTYYASTAYNLRPVIANWYNILRDISIVGMLSILVYVGIRIMLSSTAGDKAKYKQLLVDWVVAICLLFLMQYIMSFSNIAVKKVTSVIQSAVVSTTEGDKLSANEKKAAEEKGKLDGDVAVTRGTQLFEIEDKELVEKAYQILVEENKTDTDYSKLFTNEDSGSLYWPTNNFTEQARMLGQLTDKDDDATNYAYASIGYKIIYIVLVLYTLIFTWTYVKRVVYMAFLTMIAPLVALTYPIDKMNDGKAQAFNMWFKEYIFNLLIQPLHLILYMVLIGSAMTFASQNLIYAVVAIGFMTPAEKLMRKFFGFEKAQTPGMFAGPAGTALMMSGMNRILGKKPPHPPKDGGKGGSSDDGGGAGDPNSLRFKEDVKTDSIYDTDYDYDGNDNKDNATELNVVNGNGNVDSLTEEEKDAKKKSFGVIIGGKADGEADDGADTSDQEDKNNSESEENDKKPGIIGGLRRTGEKFVSNHQDDKPLRKIAGVTTGILGAGAATLTAGLISLTDPQNAVRNMATAGLAGYNLGKNAPDSIIKTAKNADDYVQTFKEGADPVGYAQKQIEENVKKRSKDLNYRNEVRQRLDKMGMTNVSFDEYYDQYGQYAVRKGQNSAAEGTAGFALMKEEGYSKESAAQFVKSVKNEEHDTSKYDDEKSTNLNNTIRNSVVKNNKGKNLTNEQIDNHVNKVRNSYDKASKYLYMKL